MEVQLISAEEAIKHAAKPHTDSRGRRFDGKAISDYSNRVNPS
jgi:hypothetical protein